MSGGFARGLKHFVEDEFSAVSMPRYMTITGTKVGFVLRFMQCILVAGIVMHCVWAKIWLQSYIPVAVDDALYIERGDWSESPTVLHHPSNHPFNHCTQAASYWFDHNGIRHRPAGCRALDYYEAATLEGEHLFIPSFIKERTLWHGHGAWCSETGRSWCSSSSINGSFVATSPTDCSCKVDTSSSKFRPWLVEGRTDSAHIREGPHNSLKEQPKESLLTKVLHKDRVPCTVGGRSEWLHADAWNGISGTVEEWLACAGESLDDAPRQQAKFSGAVPRLRTMDFTMQFTFDYQNQHALSHRGVVCYLTVEVLTQGTLGVNTYIHLDIPAEAAGLTKIERAQTRHGIRLKNRVTGSYHTFDISKVVTMLVNLLVLVKLPHRLACFVLLYCFGLTSEIYRRAIRSKLNVIKYFQNAVAQILIAEAGFRGLLGGKWKETPDNLQGLRKQHLFKHMNHIFDHHLKSGDMQVDTVKSLTAAFFQHIDNNDSGDISCQEFIEVATENEAVDVHTMTRFFSKHTMHKGFSFQDVLGPDTSILFGRLSKFSVPGASASLQGLIFKNHTEIPSQDEHQLQEQSMHAGNRLEELQGHKLEEGDQLQAEEHYSNRLEELQDDKLEEGEIDHQTPSCCPDIIHLENQLSRFQHALVALTRRLERVEIRDMTEQISTWKI